MKIISLDHIHVYCRDPEASAAFYSRHFGAAEVHRNVNDKGHTRIFLNLGGQIFVVGPNPPGIEATDPPAPADGAYTHGFGVAHFGLRVADLAAAVAELESEGVSILSRPVHEPSGLEYAYVAAPDGVIVELTQYGSVS